MADDDKLVPLAGTALPGDRQITLPGDEEDDDDGDGDGLSSDGEIPPWERQPDESQRAFHYFTHYRDMPNRTMRAAYAEHKKRCQGIDINPRTSPRRWHQWSSQYHWVRRAQAWDLEVDRQARKALIASQAALKVRHAEAAQAALSVLTVPTTIAMAALQLQDGKILKDLITKAGGGTGAFMSMLRDASRMAAILPSVMAAERMAVGLTSESIGVVEEVQDHGLANRITDDPEATKLAVQLLHRLADTRESPPVGTGVSGEPGQVETDPPSRPPDGTTG